MSAHVIAELKAATMAAYDADKFLISLFGGNFHHPLFKKPKNQHTSGTFHDHAFQMSLSLKETEDPLNIKLFDQLWCGL